MKNVKFVSVLHINDFKEWFYDSFAHHLVISNIYTQMFCSLAIKWSYFNGFRLGNGHTPITVIYWNC